MDKIYVSQDGENVFSETQNGDRYYYDFGQQQLAEGNVYRGTIESNPYEIISSEEAMNYVSVLADYDYNGIGNFYLSISDDGDYYTIQGYEDTDWNAATFNWYYVDKYTGEVLEKKHMWNDYYVPQQKVVRVGTK